MKFKKFLGAVCSFLLAASSFVTGGSVGAKSYNGQNLFVLMLNSEEKLGNSKNDKNDNDWEFYDYVINDLITNHSMHLDGFDTPGYVRLRTEGPLFVTTKLDECGTDIKKSMELITGQIGSPDVFIVVANLTKDAQTVEQDVNEHLDNILLCEKECKLFDFINIGHKSSKFEPNGQKVRLSTVPIVIYGVVPKDKEQLTSNKELEDIAEKIKNSRMGDAEGQFKYIYDEINIRQNDTSVCVNTINNYPQRNADIVAVVQEIAQNPNLKPLECGNFLSENELKAFEARCQREENSGWSTGKTLLVGGGALAFAIGGTLAIINGIKQHKDENKNKTKVPKAQENQVKNQAKTQVLESTAAV